jgi:trehalose synthase
MMYGTTTLTRRSLADYLDVVGEDKIAELREAARPLRGLRVLNLSVTAFGTGVADLLRSSVPLLSDLGLDCRWQVVRTADEFASVNKAMYAALGGTAAPWTTEMSDVWLRYSAMNADLLTEDHDVVVVHDPQPTGIRSFVEESKRASTRWVMHGHLDISRAQEEVWLLLRQHMEQYDALIYDLESFPREGVGAGLTRVILPAIDPLGARNMELSERAVVTVLEQYGIDLGRPLLCQVSPLDETCDPLGAIEVFERVREEAPDLQLALVSTHVPEEPGARSYFDDVARKAQDYADIHVLSRLTNVGNVETNVFQRASHVVLQRALRRGFGLWASDTLWKERPIVAARGGGMPHQVLDGETGFLVEGSQQFVERIVQLLRDPALAREMGRAGRRHVAENFLITRYLHDYIRLLEELVSARPDGATP